MGTHRSVALHASGTLKLASEGPGNTYSLTVNAGKDTDLLSSIGSECAAKRAKSKGATGSLDVAEGSLSAQVRSQVQVRSQGSKKRHQPGKQDSPNAQDAQGSFVAHGGSVKLYNSILHILASLRRLNLSPSILADFGFYSHLFNTLSLLQSFNVRRLRCIASICSTASSSTLELNQERAPLDSRKFRTK